MNAKKLVKRLVAEVRQQRKKIIDLEAIVSFEERARRRAHERAEAAEWNREERLRRFDYAA